MLYLDDIAVGDRASFGQYVVTREEVLAFATAYDPQPFHLSDEGAAATHFGRLAASGWHTAAMTMRLIVDSAFRPAGGIIGFGGELQWLKPVRPGDELRAESEILELRESRSRPDQGLVKVRVTTLNQRGEAVQTFTPTLLVKKRSA